MVFRARAPERYLWLQVEVVAVKDGQCFIRKRYDQNDEPLQTGMRISSRLIGDED